MLPVVVTPRQSLGYPQDKSAMAGTSVAAAIKLPPLVSVSSPKDPPMVQEDTLAQLIELTAASDWLSLLDILTAAVVGPEVVIDAA
jgi:hypothetical protein